jgi:uncharacterized protein YjiS (DUF1127 family)
MNPAQVSNKFAVKTSGVTALLWQVTGALCSRCRDTLLVWQKRGRQRRELRSLLSLDDRTLADIGVSRFWVRYEASKRFWQPRAPVAHPSTPSGTSREKER